MHILYLRNKQLDLTPSLTQKEIDLDEHGDNGHKSVEGTYIKHLLYARPSALITIDVVNKNSENQGLLNQVLIHYQTNW